MDDEEVVHAMRWCTRTRKFNTTQQRFFKDFVLALKDVSLPPDDLYDSKPLGKGSFGVIEESVCHAASLSLWLLLYLSVCLFSVVRSSPLSLSSEASKASFARNVSQAPFWQVLAQLHLAWGPFVQGPLGSGGSTCATMQDHILQLAFQLCRDAVLGSLFPCTSMHVREITHSLKDRSLTARQSLVATPYVCEGNFNESRHVCECKMSRI